MTTDNSQKKPEPNIIQMDAAQTGTSTFLAYILVEANLAKEWLADTLKEADRETADTIGSIRREIVFAVSFAESYIFEWARDVAGSTQVLQYFNHNEPFETVKQRWQRVPVRLHQAELIKTESKPTINWGTMGEVTQYRNGLVHGVASIPSGLKSEKPEPPKPTPTLADLSRRGQGWALSAVLNVAGQLHRQTDTPPPQYLKDYIDSP